MRHVPADPVHLHSRHPVEESLPGWSAPEGLWECLDCDDTTTLDPPLRSVCPGRAIGLSHRWRRSQRGALPVTDNRPVHTDGSRCPVVHPYACGSAQHDRSGRGDH